MDHRATQLIESIKKVYKVSAISEAQLRALRDRTKSLVSDGASPEAAAHKAALEIFKPGAIPDQMLKEAWDLSWYRANAGSLVDVIDEYFRSKE